MTSVLLVRYGSFAWDSREMLPYYESELDPIANANDPEIVEEGLFRCRIQCRATPNCKGQLKARDNDQIDDTLRQGGVHIVKLSDGRFTITEVYYPPVFVERDGTIVHIKRSRPRSTAMHSADARAYRLRR
jgi:hypothetical protein